MLKPTHFTNRIIWILLAWFALYELLDEIFIIGFYSFLKHFFWRVSNAMMFVFEYYTPLIASVAFFVVFCLLSKKNRFLLDVIKPTREGRSMKMLGFGILLGFLTNFFCILCAMLHGDVKFYYDFSASQIPVMVFAFICVFFQSTSEELWCRCYLYERINVHYPLWLAILINGTLFGLMHIFNDGITVLAMADLIFCGIFYSLARWYSGSIWISFGMHTMWNFTQQFIFGLPNSGLVSEASIFHLDALNATSNLIYDYTFGVEGALPAVLMEILPIVVILLLAKRDGRLGELRESRESRGEMPVLPPKTPEPPVVEIPQ